MNEMYKKILELRASYKSKVEDMTAINDKSSIEKRDLNDDELKRFDELNLEARKLSSEAERLESLYTHKTGIKIREHNAVENGDIGGRENSIDKDLSIELNRSFSEWVASGDKNKEQEYRNLAREFEQVRATTPEILSASGTGNGKALMPHEILFNELMKDVDKTNIVREHARIIKYSGASQITFPVLASKGLGAKWLSEVEKSSESTYTFAQKSLTTHRLSSTVPVSLSLIENTPFALSSVIANEMRIDITEKLEQAYLFGDGDKKPLGILKTNSEGITVDRDISIGTSTDLVTWEGFLEAELALNAKYKKNAALFLSSQGIAEFRKMKDKSGKPLLQESLQVGGPRTFMGYVIVESDQINTGSIKQNDYLGFLADLKSGYYIVDNKEMNMFVFNEMYRPWNSIGFQVDMFTGGMPVDQKAFVRIKAGAKTASKTV